MKSRNERKSSYIYKTKETEVFVEINIDGSGKTEINTGIGFFDHLLENMAIFGLLDLKVNAIDNKVIDHHHVVEDTGIALGEALKIAVGSRDGISRIGFCYIPLDETLVRVSLDLSGRAFLFLNSRKNLKFETFDFLRAFVSHSFITLHIDIIRGENEHHLNEAIFKGLGLSLRKGLEFDKRIKGVLSSK